MSGKKSCVQLQWLLEVERKETDKRESQNIKKQEKRYGTFVWKAI